MPHANSNGIQIEYEEFGSPKAPPLLLVMGLGAQMIFWREPFCEALAERGFRVIRFDNRDVGKSTWLENLGTPDIMSAVTASLSRQPVTGAPYLLVDMAGDAAGLLDALGVDGAHVVGASMGGMIAQTLAIAFPKRVRSLVSIMSSTGNPDLPPAKPEALAALLSPPATTREGNIERLLATFRIIGSPGFPLDEVEFRDVAGRSFDRGFNPNGVMRQLVAVLASGSRRDALQTVKTPTLVIHGKDDPLVPIEAGEDTAAAVPGAKLLAMPGMGHDLPAQVWPQIIDAIVAVAQRA